MPVAPQRDDGADHRQPQEQKRRQFIGPDDRASDQDVAGLPRRTPLLANVYMRRFVLGWQKFAYKYGTALPDGHPMTIGSRECWSRSSKSTFHQKSAPTALGAMPSFAALAGHARKVGAAMPAATEAAAGEHGSARCRHLKSPQVGSALRSCPSPFQPEHLLVGQNSSGRRPKLDTIAGIDACAGNSVFRWHPEVVDADLADYFGSIPHAELLKSVARRIADRRVLPASLLSYRPDPARSRCPAVDKVFSHSTPPAFHFQAPVKSVVAAISLVLRRIQTIQMPRFPRASSRRRPGGGRDPSLPSDRPSPVWQNFCWQYWFTVECPKSTNEVS